MNRSNQKNPGANISDCLSPIFQATGKPYRTFAALVDPTRRAILARLEREDGASISALAQPFAIKLPAVMKHLDVLDDAGLITRSKVGRTVTVRLRPQHLRPLLDRSKSRRSWRPFITTPKSKSLSPRLDASREAASSGCRIVSYGSIARQSYRWQPSTDCPPSILSATSLSAADSFHTGQI
jgi:DNA-binding transcriptional ArsR family regulator